MARTDERLALILEYVVEGRGNIDGLSDQLETLDNQTEKLKRGGFDFMNYSKHQKNIKKFKQGFGDLGNQMKNTRGNTRKSNIALMNFNRIVQDAPFGIMGIANNIPMMVESFSDLTQQVGPSGKKKGATGAIKSMIGAMAGPGGMIMMLASAIPTIILMADKFGLFASEGSNASKVAEKFTEKIDDLLQKQNELRGFGEDSVDPQAVKSKIDTIDGFIKELQSDVEESEPPWWMKATTGFSMGGMSGALQMMFHTTDEIANKEAVIEKLKEKQKGLQAELTASKMIENSETSKQLDKENREISAKKAKLDLEKARAELLQNMKVQDEIIEPDPIDVELKGKDPMEEEKKRQEQALKSFPEKMMQEKVRMAQMTGNRVKALNMQRRQELNSMLDLEIADYEKAQKLKARINERYNKQIKNVEEQQTKQRIGMYAQMAQGISSIITSLFGESKGAQIAGAIINTLAGITQALSAYPPPLSFVQAGAVAAQGFATVKRIKNTDMNSKNTGGSKSYRSGGNAQFSSGASNVPTSALTASRNRGIDGSTVRLEDDAGNFLTRLQFAKDSQAGDEYLIDK